MDTPTKRCLKCGRELPRTRDSFYQRKDVKDGLATYCKTCVKALAKVWQQANPTRMGTKRRRYLLTHYEENLAYQRRWRAQHPEQIRAIKWRAYQRRKAHDAGKE